MNYYKILVTSNRYKGNKPLTYASEIKLFTGQIVLVPLKNTRASGLVLEKVFKPNFQAKTILSLQISTPLPSSSIRLLEWLTKYYPAHSSNLVSLFVPSSLKTGINEELTRLKDNSHPRKDLPPLTNDQRKALIAIERGSTTLIHGDTGTGKTRLYLERTVQMLAKKRSVLILTPEIGLTSQLATYIQEHISQPVVTLHSNLTGAARRKIWQQIHSSKHPLVIIGPRSALFSPISDLGLIIIDEAHDNAYKQDQSPYYYAPRVAGKLAKIHNAQLILGTATPSVSEYFILSEKKLPIVRLKQIAVGDLAPPKISIIDTKNRTNFSLNRHLSDTLLNKIESNISRDEQSLIFLNRRGTARLIQCQSCGWKSTCPNCELPLTYHGDTHSARCHTCGYQNNAQTRCPDCLSNDVIYKTIGTKAIVDILQNRFPNALIRRFDTDSRKNERLENNYSDVKTGNTDILVGTQVLVKGLDLPKLSLVGIVAADTSLNFPDYTADEQTYQLLSQVIGRVGRGHIPGNVVIQTSNPSSNTLKAVLNKNWNEFYVQQLSDRRQFEFPPFCHVVKLYCSRKSQTSAIKSASVLADKLRKSNLRIKVIGPSPRFIEITKGQYNWQLILKAKDRNELLKAIELLPPNWAYNLDPINLL
ncbi:primosomal protein N' [Candidatus Saccharibacteria bacterium]|nr:primosomal protein N' [Candidatus Saccharibacteria bacterium]